MTNNLPAAQIPFTKQIINIVDITMKYKFISVFIAATLTIIGLCSTISHAADKQFIIQTAYNSASAHSMKAVKFIKKSPNQINLLAVNTVEQMINRPLLNIYSSISAEYIPEQTFIKKNEMFELVTIFNDKLQQIIAKFSFDKSHQNESHFINSDKPNDNNSINCNITKQ